MFPKGPFGLLFTAADKNEQSQNGVKPKNSFHSLLVEIPLGNLSIRTYIFENEKKNIDFLVHSRSLHE